jgi:predicted oxidoreductase
MSLSRVTLADGSTSLSRIIAGFWRLNAWEMSDAELQAFVEALIAEGMTSMDHAFVYRSEAPFGSMLKQAPQLRDQMEIISKFGIRPTGFGPLGAETTNHYESTASYLVESVENSLRDLNTDRIDLMLVHRPDFLMDADELAGAFEKLIAEGKVLSFGVSNFTTAQFSLLQSRFSKPLVTNQVEYSPLCLDPLEDGVLDQCQELKVNPMFWSCLGGGRLMTGTDERSVRVRNALRIVAEEVGAESLEQVIFAWVLKHPSNPLPIVGSSKIERVRASLAAEKLELTREHWYAVWEASKGHRVP